MKKIVTIFALAFVTTTTFSQKKSTFKGPEYKNYKAWEHKVEPIIIFSNTAKQELNGPEYKNFKVKEIKEENYQVLTITTSKRTGLKGPAYKNFKPWKKD